MRRVSVKNIDYAHTICRNAQGARGRASRSSDAAPATVVSIEEGKLFINCLILQTRLRYVP